MKITLLRHGKSDFDWTGNVKARADLLLQIKRLINLFYPQNKKVIERDVVIF